MTSLLHERETNKLLSGLNEEQEEAVVYDEGPLLVLAGAGSGKTRVLTHRAAWFMSEKKVEAQNILLLTFTNKAAKEMKQRIESLITNVPGYAGTFHSFCARMLRIDGIRIGIPNNFVIYDEQDKKDTLKDIIEDLGLSPESYKPAGFAAQISNAKNEMLTPLQYGEIAKGEWQEKVFLIYNEYEKYLKKSNALDFDDLLLKTVALLENDNPALSKWQHILTHIFVDEWQDTNKAQYKLTKLLVGKNTNITAVGDASQAIYGWRGADYRNINYLIKDYPNIKVINLERNYRSTQNILSAANSVIAKNTSHPILSLWTKETDGEKIKLYRAKSELDEADYVVETIDNLTTRGYEFHDIGVLYRTNAQSRVIEEALLHSGIPYTLVGGVRFYDRKEIKDVLAFLRLVINPEDRVSHTRVEKIGKRISEKFQETANEIGDITNLTTLEIMDKVIQKTGYLTKYEKDSEENMMRLENIKELRSVAMEFSKLDDFLVNVALVEAEQDDKGLVHANTDSNGKVTLMTIHAAKGLEFGAVFIVGMEEGLFPHSRTLFDSGELEEERRLAYVGITRAKKLLYLTYASRRLYFGQRTSNPPSRFIIDIPEKLLEGAEQQHNVSYHFDDDPYDPTDSF
jgi:DNA helicase-2/ATP-dependent DNA helicase PcrA